MTLGEMETNIRYALGLREPDEQPMILAAIQAGVRDLLRRTSCFQQCIDADLPDGATRFELGPSIIKIVHIFRGGTRRERVGFHVLPAHAGCYAQTGQIIHWNEPFEVGESVQLYAVPRPDFTDAAWTDDSLLEDEQWGGIAPEFQDAVELYACSLLASRSDDSTSSMGQSYWVQYVGQDGHGGRCAEIRRETNMLTGMTLGGAEVSFRP